MTVRSYLFGTRDMNINTMTMRHITLVHSDSTVTNSEHRQMKIEFFSRKDKKDSLTNRKSPLVSIPLSLNTRTI